MTERNYENFTNRFFSLFSLWTGACNYSAERISYADKKSTPSLTIQSVSEELYLAENEEIVNRSGEIELIFMGELTIKNGKIISGNDWASGKDNEIELTEKLTFDVMTCIGFVGKAKLKKYHGEDNSSNRGYGWEMDFILSKANKINENSLAGCLKENNQMRAFAVFPSKDEREKIQIKNSSDLKAVFDTLSSQDKNWIASFDSHEKKKSSDSDIEATDGF